MQEYMGTETVPELRRRCGAVMRAGKPHAIFSDGGELDLGKYLSVIPVDEGRENRMLKGNIYQTDPPLSNPFPIHHPIVLVPRPIYFLVSVNLAISQPSAL